MNITMLTYGSRGDVQPFLALARGLNGRGHRVTLAAPGRFKDFVESHGVAFHPLAGNPEDLSRRLNDSGHNFIKMVHGFMGYALDIGAQVLRQTEQASRDADLIVHSFAHAAGAHTLARERGLPDIHIQTFPMFTPTGDYPNITMPDLGNRFFNRLTHTFSGAVFALSSRMGYEQVRRSAGYPRRKLFNPFRDDASRQRTPILCAWSPEILPPSSDWGPHVHVTGYYFLAQNADYQPPPELDEFLRSGEPPVCVTFGSMVNREAGRIDGIVREALKRSGYRGIIQAGWAGVRNQSTRDLLYLESVPHEWLLPRCRLVVHHGGAGTTSAGLRAGIPGLIIPFTGDQPFWGRRLHAAGAGPGPILAGRLSTDRLVRALADADEEGVQARARRLGERIRGENGVLHAAELIEAHAAGWRAG